MTTQTPATTIEQVEDTLLVSHTSRTSLLRLNFDLWRAALLMARHHGWNPIGCLLPPRPAEEDCSLRCDFSGRGQFVLKQDAAALANALSFALQEIPDKSNPNGQDPHRAVKDVHFFFAGPNRSLISDLVNFCRLGPFWIH